MARYSEEVPTTEMKVTSVRLEKELIKLLKEQKYPDGYQSLMRKVLWDYIKRNAGQYKPNLDENSIEGKFEGRTNREQVCALTGRIIPKGERCMFGITTDGNIVPVALY